MKKMHAAWVVTLALGLATTASAKTKAGVSLPDTTKVAGQTLVLNGLGVREATIFNVDVYVAGLYLKAKSADAGAILKADDPKKIVLAFVRDVDKDEMFEALANGVKSAASKAQQAKLKPKIDQLSRMITPVKKGQKATFTYVPGTGLTITIGGKKQGVIKGSTFGRFFFAIWLGKNPPNRGLKSGLLGG